MRSDRLSVQDIIPLYVEDKYYVFCLKNMKYRYQEPRPFLLTSDFFLQESLYIPTWYVIYFCFSEIFTHKFYYSSEVIMAEKLLGEKRKTDY